MAIGEAGSITTNSPGENDPITVTFSEALEDPIFSLTATSNGGDPFVLRVTDIQPTQMVMPLDLRSSSKNGNIWMDSTEPQKPLTGLRLNVVFTSCLMDGLLKRVQLIIILGMAIHPLH